MFDGLPEFVEVSSNVFLFPLFFFFLIRIVIDLLKGFTDCDSFIGTLFFCVSGLQLLVYWQVLYSEWNLIEIKELNSFKGSFLAIVYNNNE